MRTEEELKLILEQDYYIFDDDIEHVTVDSYMTLAELEALVELFKLLKLKAVEG